MIPTLNLSIPPQRKPEPGAFDTRPDAVRVWLEHLPLGHAGETARRLYLVLHEVNRLDVNIHHRLDFLEQVAPPLQGVLVALKPHYSGKPFPLDPKSARVAQLAAELKAAMVVGCQIVMQQSDSLNWFRQRKWERIWTTALHRMLHYFGGIFSVHAQLHMAPPPGAWLMIHSAYRLLEENRLLETVVPGIGGAAPTSLGHEYKQLLLLALLPPQRMQPAQLDEVHNHMAQWTAALELSRPASHLACVEAYCIDLDQDAAPGPLWRLHPAREPNVHSLRQLRMTPLLEQIAQQVARQRAAAARITLPSGAEVQRDTAAQLLACWLRPPERAAAREQAGDEVHAVFGLREIHALLSGADAAVAAPDTADEPVPGGLAVVDGGTDRKQSFARSLGFVGERDEEADIWDMVYRSKPPEPSRSWHEVEVARSYRLLAAERVNRSSGGVGLRFAAATLGAVRNGDLVALHAAGEEARWTLGAVRWLRSGAAGGIEMGVKRLHEQVVPAAICVEQDGRRSAPIDCLLGHEQEQLRVVLPQIAGLASKRLLLQSGGREVHINLLEQLESSALFQMYRCAEHQAKREQAPAKATENDPFDKFKSVWDLL